MPTMKARLAIVVGMLATANSALALDSSAYRLQLGGGGNYRLQTESTAIGVRPGRLFNKPSPTLAAKPYADEIASAAHEAGVDPALVHAVIQVESAYRADAVSAKGALGLMQVMPDTARRFGVQDASEPKANLKAGTRYLRVLLDLFDQRIELALAAYNAGEGAVLRYAGNIPPYPETQRYVPAVMGKFNEWRTIPAPKKADYLAGTRLQKAEARNEALPNRPQKL
jgi:soluble lytic murein transglycosylase-like protein